MTKVKQLRLLRQSRVDGLSRRYCHCEARRAVAIIAIAGFADLPQAQASFGLHHLMKTKTQILNNLPRVSSSRRHFEYRGTCAGTCREFVPSRNHPCALSQIGDDTRSRRAQGRLHLDFARPAPGRRAAGRNRQGKSASVLFFIASQAWQSKRCLRIRGGWIATSLRSLR